MNKNSDEEIRKFILASLPKVTTFIKNITVSDHEVLQETFEGEDVASLIEDLTHKYDVDFGSFVMFKYYPWKTKTLFNKTPDNSSKTPLSINMFIESVKQKRWLYD